MRNAIHALVVTSDAWLVGHFTQIAKGIGIETQASAGNPGITAELTAAKYEAVLVDFDTVPEAMAILSAVRQSRSNQTAVVFAIATGATAGQGVLEKGANLRLERPLEAKQIRRALRASYELMVRERRRYFRCTAELPVLVIQASTGADFRCTSMNVSSNGIALSTPAGFKPGEEVQLVISLEDPDLIIRTTGTVVWDDQHGKTGISFKCASPQHQTDLDAWLDRQLLVDLGHTQSDQGVSPSS